MTMNHQIETPNLRMTVYCALFTALIIIGAYISIPLPIGPVPITLADFFVMLAGLFIGGKYGLLSVILYLALGAIGMPIFSGGGSGFAFLLGPTGGFLFGYLFLVATIGFIKDKEKASFTTVVIGIIIGNLLLYASGILWLKITLDMSLKVAIAAGLIPFLPGTLIKISVILAIERMMIPRFKAHMMRLK